eukprot:5624133-Lingulodinium_polyedra.AAC.1
MRRGEGNWAWWAWCRACKCWADDARVEGSRHQKNVLWYAPPTQAGCGDAAGPGPAASLAPSAAS